MPRQSRSGGGRAPSRPTAPQRQVAPQQTRQATSAAYPPAARPAAPAAAPPAQQQQSGGGSMLGNIASTAAGVAIGSSVGHAITGFFGGSSAPAAEQPQQNAVASQGNEASENSWGQRSCEVDAKQFTKCLDENQGNMQICGWYLEQLKACQQAAKPY
ncbi:hypothetical protein BKA65DRAFT_507769 [Rhexocercosporidium sp. MPI-PUGE-AT-0058]|nr:hypothetical protein BKA65DRAFT_507769 [Rhexocercosporidium sp. MPI-PUGE-AT-0058]